MLKLNVKISACLIIGLISMNAYAFNNAGRVHVEIKNSTANNCQIGSYNPYSGSLESSPPSSIKPNETKAFDVYQAKNGVFIDLMYYCGANEWDMAYISFSVKQDYVKSENQTPEVASFGSNRFWLTSSVTASSISNDTQSTAKINIQPLS